MAAPRPLASLSPALLARKGAARPAMRPQGFALSQPAAPTLDDLGWSDMGTPDAAEAAPAGPVEAAPIPTVLVDRAELARRLETVEPVKSVSLPTAQRLRRETSHVGKAALTLRLDANRHLKLRLAGAVTNRSAQDLMTEALDALLDALPTVGTLVEQLAAAPRPARHNGTKP